MNMSDFAHQHGIFTPIEANHAGLRGTTALKAIGRIRL